MKRHPLLSLLLAVSGLLALSGCTEDGIEPDCPLREEYTDAEGNFDFSTWRKAAEEKSCMTPIGGYPSGPGGGAS